MSEEEKEQWLYEEYQYTSNFDFSRLDKYEEANDELCIDDLILDYTMLYEHYKKRIERLNKIIDKAIEYIKSSQHYGKEKVFRYVNGDDILEILNKEKQDV